MRYFFFLIFYCLLLVPNTSRAQDSSFLRLDTEFSAGSGTHLGDGLILTAAHIILAEHFHNPMQPITDIVFNFNSETVKGIAKVLWIDKDADIAFLQADNFTDLKQSKLSCTNPNLHDSLYTSAFPLDLGRIDLNTSVVGKTLIRPDYLKNHPSFLVQMPTIPGMSGGALVNENHEVVGMIEAVITNQTKLGIMTFGLGMAMPGSTLCEGLEKYKSFLNNK